MLCSSLRTIETQFYHLFECFKNLQIPTERLQRLVLGPLSSQILTSFANRWTEVLSLATTFIIFCSRCPIFTPHFLISFRAPFKYLPHFWFHCLALWNCLFGILQLGDNIYCWQCAFFACRRHMHTNCLYVDCHHIVVSFFSVTFLFSVPTCHLVSMWHVAFACCVARYSVQMFGSVVSWHWIIVWLRHITFSSRFCVLPFYLAVTYHSLTSPSHPTISAERLTAELHHTIPPWQLAVGCSPLFCLYLSWWRLRSSISASRLIGSLCTISNCPALRCFAALFLS